MIYALLFGLCLGWCMRWFWGNIGEEEARRAEERDACFQKVMKEREP